MNRDLWIFVAIAVLVLAGLGTCAFLVPPIDLYAGFEINGMIAGGAA